MLIVAGALALAGCDSSLEPEPIDDATTPTPDEVGETTEPEITGVWPLTGLQGDVAERPALAVKIENSPQARPQTGLEHADIVWEEMVEGGITRYNAVYHSRLPETVGPIRSVRPMDAGIAAPLGGLIAFSGGQPGFVADIRASGLQGLSHDEGASGFWRSSDRRAPHNVYGSVAMFLEQADESRTVPPPEQFAFADVPGDATAALAGEPAATLVTAFPSHSATWDWDESSGAWLRSEAGEASMSASGVQHSAVNVVVLRVEVRSTGTVDASGASVPETVMVGSGEALVAGGGRTVSVGWSKASTTDPVVLTYAEGTAVELAPGNTWIELVPVNGGSVAVS